MKDIDTKGDQEKLLLLAVRDVLKKLSLTFSEQGFRSILSYIKVYQSSLTIPTRPVKSEIRKQIKSLKSTAILLSKQIQALSPHIQLVDHEDPFLLKLDHLVLCCEWALTHHSEKFQNEGRPVKGLPLKLLVQRLIIIFEKEIGKKYVIKESFPGGRERTMYDPLIQKYVRGILKLVAPSEDVQEAMKATRRSPVPLDWVRNMQNNLDEEFSKKSK